MAWLALAVSILFEVIGTTCLKISVGMSKLLPTLGVALFYGLSFYLFSVALKRIELSIAYAVWAGVGTALVAIIGMVFFREAMSLLKLSSIALIIMGVVGLNLSTR